MAAEKWTGGLGSMLLECPIAPLWELASDWAHWDRFYPSTDFQMVTELIEGENRKPGCMRYAIVEPGTWTNERLLAIDNENYSLSYNMEENTFAGGLTGYVAKAQFRETADGKTMLEHWTWEVEPLTTQTREEFTAFICGFLEQKLVRGLEAAAAKAKAAAGPTAAQVKELREKSGAGMMDCKKALVACGNDVNKASDYLRKKGLGNADMIKASHSGAEGRVGSYVHHDGRIGVLVEVICETDSAARSAQVKELVADLGMQVVACPHVQYVTVDEIPASFVEKEKEIQSGREDLAMHPEEMRERIVEGRVAKTLRGLALLEQPYIKDPHHKVLVKEYVNQIIAALGENIQVRRFVRFNLGE